MRILLVQGYLGGFEHPVFPLGLHYLARLTGDHQVEIFDPNVSRHPEADFRSRLIGFRPDVVGISLRNIDSTNKTRVVYYYPYFQEALHIIRKELGSRCRVVVGGPGFSMFAEKIMHLEPMIDYGVFLEGEETFPELLKNLHSPERVRGLYCRRGDRVIFGGHREPVSLKKVPLPERSGSSLRPYLNAGDAVGVETKRGCPLSCAYCIYGFLNGKAYRLFSPDRVVDDMQACAGNGVRELMFIDPVFNIPLSHAQAVCEEIIRRNLHLPWSAWFHESTLTRPFIRLLRKAGCKKIMLSPDGFGDRALKRLGKMQRKRDVLAGFKLLKEEIGDMEVCYNFFKNPPGQTWGGALGLFAFYLKAKLDLKNRVHFEFNKLRIEPHTRLFEMALREGVITEKDDLLYPRHYTNPSTILVERLLDIVSGLKERL